MSLAIKLNRESDQALYQQIVEQIKAHICDGRLPAATQLPTVRELAKQLGVTRLTVQNAYSELQSGGWVEATIGRGTFVNSKVRPQAVMQTMAARPEQPLTVDGVMSDMLRIHQFEISQSVSMRSMAVAAPDPHLFPGDDFWYAMRALERDLLSFTGYGSPQGDPVLRVAMATQLRKRGIRVDADGIIITNGLTQGLSLTVQALARPGDVVFVEQPSYLGFLNILKAQNLQPVGIPLDDEGPRLDVLERAVIQHRPRFFYTIPSFQNPTGLCVSAARRRGLLDLARQHGFLLVEDDIYARLSYDEEPPPAIKAEDQHGLVVYLTSESKVLMPGLRIGAVVAPPLLHDRLLALRRTTDLCSPGLSQRALALFIQQRGMQRHLKRVLPIYRRRRDALLEALPRHMPRSVTWTKPAGGFCCWLTLPNTPALRDIHRVALHHGLALAPGDVFLSESDPYKHLRLSFGNLNEEAIRQSVALLGRLIEERLNAEPPRAEVYDFTPLV